MIFDCEGDGLVPTKFHVLSYWNGEKVVSLTSHEEMRKWLLKQKTLIGHNIIRWDIPQLERVLKIQIKAKLVDTLALSWYLFPNRKLHGLEWWGTEYKLKKLEVLDWSNESLDVYIARCERDVEITKRLWEDESRYLSTLYDTNKPLGLRIIPYLSFKLDCAREQERSKWKVNIEKVEHLLGILEEDKAERVEQLKSVMPMVTKYVPREYPAKPFKKDGTLSVEGAKWQKYISEQGLTNDHRLPILIPHHEDEPNPNSPEQVKAWLFSLGWEPETFKEVKEKNGGERLIPQIKKLDEPELCDSVIRLIDTSPQVAFLEGLSVVNHRLGILKGFKENADEEGFIKAEIQGLTNTLRFKHTVVVNLPGVDKPYGEEIRGCLEAREGYELLGSDMSGLEDATKRHYMFEYDPEYVKAMSAPGFDPHLDLAVIAGVLKPEQIRDTNTAKKIYKAVRDVYKEVNYSAIYGVGAVKLARTLGIALKEARAILKAYWKRNWSVKKIAEDQRVKQINGQSWLYNPVSQFYYSLRWEKDRFSTLNQGTGVYCFDSWVREIRKVRPQLTAQFHDEICLEVKKGHQNSASALVQDAIDKVNEQLKLNVTLSVDIKFGRTYSEVH